jgi:pilus assembly protein CpaE
MDPFSKVILVGCEGNDGAKMREALVDCALEVEAAFPDVRSAIDGIRLSQNEKRTCIVQVRSEDDVQQLRWLSESFVGRPLMAAVPEVCDPELLFAISRAGAGQILPLPLRPDHLRDSLENVRRRYAVAEAVSARRVLAVSGVTGGCGATTIAINLAYEISHLLGLSCIFVELSTQMGMAATFLDINPKQTINDLLCDMRTVDLEFVERRLTKITDKFRVLPGPYQEHDRLEHSPQDVLALISYLKQLSDVVVLDIPGSNYSANVQTYAAADQLVLVAEQSVPSLRALTFMCEKLEQDQIVKPQTLVINRYNPNRKEFTVNHLQRLLQTPQLATVANDYAVVSGALNEGRALRVHAPNSAVLADIDQLARMLLAPNQLEEEPARTKRSLLGRLVRALVGR